MIQWTIFIYLIAGLSIVLLSPAYQVIQESLSDDTVDEDTERWRINAVRAICYLMAVMLWPLFLKSWYEDWRRLREANDGFTLGDFRELMETMQELSADKVSEDKFPNGIGRFGYEATNPIPCASILGSIAYLSALRMPSGERVENHRIGSTSSEVSDSPIDMYRITDQDNQEIAILYISPYQKRNSKLAPEGLKLLH